MIGPAKSSPGWKAGWPVIGSMRTPKPLAWRVFEVGRASGRAPATLVRLCRSERSLAACSIRAANGSSTSRTAASAGGSLASISGPRRLSLETGEKDDGSSPARRKARRKRSARDLAKVSARWINRSWSISTACTPDSGWASSGLDRAWLALAVGQQHGQRRVAVLDRVSQIAHRAVRIAELRHGAVQLGLAV